MKISEALHYLLDPKPADAGWNSQPPEWLTREKAAANDLEPNALKALENETGPFWYNFHDMICAAIPIYLRASGLASIREDFKHLNEFSDRQEEHIRILELQNKNLLSSWGAAHSEVVQLRKELKATQCLLDSALLTASRGEPDG